MRVLHLNCNYLGSALHQTMIEHLERLGIENQVFVPTYSRKISVVNVNKNVIVSETFRKWDRLFFHYKQAKIQKSLECEIDIKSFDCIHAYTVFTDGNTAMTMSQRYGIPYVVAVRNTDINTFFKYMVHLRHRGMSILTNARAVFFLSDEYKKQILGMCTSPAQREMLLEKSYLLPNGIDDFCFFICAAISCPKTINSEKNRHWQIIYTGKINRNKNIALTLEAIEILRKQGWDIHYTVVGKVEDQHEYDRFSGLSYVTYIPPQGKEDLMQLYRRNDLFVMPSHTESFGLVYAEAMSQGLPVIYTRGQGFDGQFPEGVVGWPVSDKDPQELANAIILCIQNYSKLHSAVIQNAKVFNWKDICEQYYKIYQCVCRNHL